MIHELLPALQAMPPHPLLEALDIGSPYVMHLAWTMAPPGRLCYLLAFAANHFPQGDHGDYHEYHNAIAEAKEIVRTLTPDDLLTIQLHAPAKVREFAILNLAKP
jgi:hypothetical protein